MDRYLPAKAGDTGLIPGLGRRLDAFKLWCWRRLLRVPQTARRSSQSILKEISPEYSLEGLTLKLQYFGHLMRRAASLEKTPMLGKIEDRRRWQQRMRWLDSITHSANMNLSKSGVLQSMGSQRVRHDSATEQQLPWRIHMPQSNKVHGAQLLSLRNATSRRQHTYSLCSATREAMAMRSPYNAASEEPLLAARESPCKAAKT